MRTKYARWEPFLLGALSLLPGCLSGDSCDSGTTIWQAMESDSELVLITLFYGVKDSGLNNTLSDPSANLTVFLPSNKAVTDSFKELGFNDSTSASKDSALSFFTSYYTNSSFDMAAGYSYVAYNMIYGGRRFDSDEQQAVLNEVTVLGQLLRNDSYILNIRNVVSSNNTYVLGIAEAGDPALITKTRVACNGVLHVLGGINLPADLPANVPRLDFQGNQLTADIIRKAAEEWEAAQAAASAPEPDDSKGSSSSSNLGVTIGVAVGVSVGVALVLAVLVAFAIVRHRQRATAKARTEEARTGSAVVEARAQVLHAFLRVDPDTHTPATPKGLESAYITSLMEDSYDTDTLTGTSLATSASLTGGGEPSSSGGRDEVAASYVIDPHKMEVAMREDGSEWLLGRGTFGEVYRAQYQGSDVAIKIMCHPDDRAVNAKQFLKEVAMLRRCQHRNVVAFKGACFGCNRSLMLVFELMTTDLMHALHGSDGHTYMWHARGRQVALDVAHGIQFIHSRKVLHSDLKSPNVLLAADGTAKVADLGQSKIVLDQFVTRSTAMGSYAWASPEQLLNERITIQSDIYSFGVILWEIATGELPMRGTLRDTRVPEECPQEVAVLIKRCLSAEADERPTASEVVSVLERFV